MIAAVCYPPFFALFWSIASGSCAQPQGRVFWSFAGAGWIAAASAGGGAPAASLLHAALLAFLAVGAITDVTTGYVFDVVAIAAGLVIVPFAFRQGALWDGAAGALAASLPLAALHGVTRGRALGLGDVKLAAVIGFAVGLRAALPCIGAAFVAGALWGVCALLRGARRDDPVAFAPFLGLGAALSLWMEGG